MLLARQLETRDRFRSRQRDGPEAALNCRTDSGRSGSNNGRAINKINAVAGSKADRKT